MSSEDTLIYSDIKTKLIHQIKKIRVDALNELENRFTPDISKLHSTESESYLNLLINVFKDEAEVCREKSINLVTLYISKQAIIDDETATSILLIVHDRLGKEPVEETSEEIRCLLSKLLILLISKNDNFSSTCLKNIIEVLNNGLNDSYSEVKKTAFELAEIVARKFPNWFPEYSENVCKNLLKCVKHKHFRVRAAAVNCLQVIVQYSDKETIRLVCSSLGECSLDSNVQVRTAILRAASFWLQELPGKYSYACYILPLILTCLLDESEECRKEANDLWGKIGLMYVKDNEEKFKEKIQYLPEEISQFESDYGVTVQNYGCHALVCDQIARILPAIITELDDWKTEVKIKSSALLKIAIIHIRSSVIPFLDTLIPALLKKSTDEEVEVSKNIIETAECIGKVVSAKIYWKLMDIHLKNGCTLNHLIILSSLLKFSKDHEIGEIIEEIASIFVQQQIFEIQESSVQQRVLEIFSKLLDCCGDMKLNTEISYNIHLILLTTMSEAEEDAQLKPLELIRILAEASEFQSFHELNRYSLMKLYDQFLESCPLWQSHSTDFKLFAVTLSRFNDDVFEIVPEKLVQILEIILQPSFDKEVSFKVLLNIGKLIENGTLNMNKSINLIEKFLLGSIKPLLVWRSGKIIEVIRNAALTIFNLYLDRVVVANLSVIYEFIPLLIGLSEDSYEETRIVALYSFVSTSRHLQPEPSSLNFFMKILTAAIQRLEDTCNRVRITASEKIAEMMAYAPVVENISNIAGDVSTSLKVFELLFIMSCDGNAQIRSKVRDVLKQPSMWNFLKQLYPRESLNKLISKCHDEELASILKSSLII
ncbi:dynein axonemal assembly factor 5 [Planococcus citri]|uniref:dynein axonemal assembly factor 5 n=1 Tax=Planococcus citri TaxID=170843 RepID=UPI0031F7E385